MNVPFLRTTAREYASQAIAWFLGLSQATAGRLTDMNAGSNIRSVLETWAIQIEQLDTKAFVALERAMPTVLYEFLGEGDGVTTSVGFPALPALPAGGPVRFTRPVGVTGAIEIPLGSQLYVPSTTTTPERVYLTLAPVTIAASETTVETLAQAVVPGTGGNVPANLLRFKDFGPSPETLAGTVEGTNPAAFYSGRAAETDEQRRVRFAAYFRNLARCQHPGIEVGARRAQILAAGAVTERVVAARSLNVPDKRGLVDCFLDNGTGGASPALVAAAQMLIDGSTAPDGTPIHGYKAAGIVVRAKAVVPQIVDVALTLAVDPGFVFSDVAAAVQAAVGAYLFNLGVFQDLVRSELVHVIQGIQGVHDVTIVTPAANVSTLFGARILPGAITVTSA